MGEVLLPISPEAIETYKQLAEDHLKDNNTILYVEAVGVDENGLEVYGIKMVCEDGSEEWYDPGNSTDDTVMGWNDKSHASFMLENKVLPNLGYTVHQKALLDFFQNMIC